MVNITVMFVQILWLLYFINMNDGAFQCLFIDNNKGALEFSNNYIFGNETALAFPEIVEYSEVMNNACLGLESNTTNLYLSVIENVLLDNGNNTGKLLFYCGQEKLPRPLILKRYINKFERNRPHKDNTTFGCKDSHNRSIPLPIGVRRCHISQFSKIEDLKPSGAVIKKSHNSGSYGEHVGDGFNSNGDKCGFHFDFSPAYNNDSRFIPDGKCSFSLSLQCIGYICCCYTNGSECENGIISSQNLACPNILFNEKINTHDDVSSFPTPETITMDAADLFVHAEQKCYFQMNVSRIGRSSLLDVGAQYSTQEDEICLNWRKDKSENGCERVERLCLDDIDDKYVYCCSFKAAEKKEILPIHGEWVALLNGDAMTDLLKTMDCYRPSSGSDDCIFFFYPHDNEFVNIRIDKNFAIASDHRKTFNQFKVSTAPQIAIIKGRILYENLRDKRGEKCNSSKSLNARTPGWYGVRLVVVKCKKSSEDGIRCDDLTNENSSANSSFLADYAKNYLNKCNTTYDGIQSTWHSYCVKNTTINPKNMSSEPMIATGPLEFEDAKYYLGKIEKHRHDSDHEEDHAPYICSEKKNRIWCVCLAFSDGRKPCNTGKIVNTRYEIAKQPELQFAKAGSSECTMRTSTNEMTCSDNREITDSQKCYFIITEAMKRTFVGCLQETSLKQNSQKYQIDICWYHYQTCEYLLQDDTGTYKRSMMEQRSKGDGARSI